MSFDDENYEHFNNESINELTNLNFKFNLYDRFISVKDENGQYFKSQTPFLKVLKPVHNTFNKKKTIAKKYIILETNDDLDFNNQVGQFMFVINKVHEISQEKIRENSMDWFNTEFDDIGLDIKVKRPIDQQKDSEFIRISIPSHLVDEVEQLSKGTYLLSTILFKGLKVSSDYIMEEWELDSFITQEKYEEMQNSELSDNLQEKLEIEGSEELENPENNLEKIEELEKKDKDSNESIELVKEEELINVDDVINVDELTNIEEVELNNRKIETEEVSNKKTFKKNSERILENKLKKNTKEKKRSSVLVKKTAKKLMF
jgi:hypothetical protein